MDHRKTKLVMFSFMVFGLTCPRARLQPRPPNSVVPPRDNRPHYTPLRHDWDTDERGYNRVRHFHVYVTQCVFISCWDPDLIERRA